jgi:hypothetical protein
MQAARNVAIIALLAFVVAVVPGGGEAAAVIWAILSMGMLAGIAWFVYRLYNEREMTLMTMADGQRALLFGSVAAIVLLFVGVEEFRQRDGGMVVWIMLMAGVIATIFFTIRSASEYS